MKRRVLAALPDILPSQSPFNASIQVWRLRICNQGWRTRAVLGSVGIKTPHLTIVLSGVECCITTYIRGNLKPGGAPLVEPRLLPEPENA